MRKATICLFVLLCSMAAFGQAQPQWKVVGHGVLLQRTDSIPETVLFTPAKAGMYRMLAYLSTNVPGTGWQADFYWTDFAAGPQVTVMSSGNEAIGETSFLFVPRAGTPVKYRVIGGNGIYNVVFTIEQLE
jgi:hypothetical protein